jgi:flagellin-like hook-associated protein FlgL
MLPDSLSFSGLGRSAIENRTLRQRIETLNTEISTGRSGEFLGDLGLQATRSLDLRAQVGRVNAHVGVIDATLSRTEMMQDTLGRLQEIASEFRAETLRLGTMPASSATSVASVARVALAEVASLLNGQSGGEYLFSGVDSANPPVVPGGNVFTAPVFQQVAAAVATLTPTNAATVLAATVTAVGNDTPADNPFARFVTDPVDAAASFRRVTTAGDGQQVSWGPFSTEGQARAAIGELVRGLSILASVTEAQHATETGFAALLDGAREALDGAGRTMAFEQATLGAAERRLTAARESALDRNVLLRKQVASIEEVDVAETVSRLQALRTRLEASYRATSILSDISLARFLR